MLQKEIALPVCRISFDASVSVVRFSIDHFLVQFGAMIVSVSRHEDGGESFFSSNNRAQLHCRRCASQELRCDSAFHGFRCGFAINSLMWCLTRFLTVRTDLTIFLRFSALLYVKSHRAACCRNLFCRLCTELGQGCQGCAL